MAILDLENNELIMRQCALKPKQTLDHKSARFEVPQLWCNSLTHMPWSVDGVWGLIILATKDNLDIVTLCNALIYRNFLSFVWNLVVAVLSLQIYFNVLMNGSSMSFLLSACMTTGLNKVKCFFKSYKRQALWFLVLNWF